MRQTIAGLIAGVAFATTMATTAPAQACAVVDPCGYSTYGYGYGYGYNNYSYGYGVRERLVRPDYYQRYASPQYYWVNQGPTYTGPGAFAPVPTYQERAVLGSRYYGRPYRYGYDGGPYGNATSHYYDGAAAVQGPVVYSYRSARRHAYRGYRHAHYRAYHMHRHHGHYGHRVKPLRYKY